MCTIVADFLKDIEFLVGPNGVIAGDKLRFQLYGPKAMDGLHYENMVEVSGEQGGKRGAKCNYQLKAKQSKLYKTRGIYNMKPFRPKSVNDNRSLLFARNQHFCGAFGQYPENGSVSFCFAHPKSSGESTFVTKLFRPERTDEQKRDTMATVYSVSFSDNNRPGVETGLPLCYLRRKDKHEVSIDRTRRRLGKGASYENPILGEAVKKKFCFEQRPGGRSFSRGPPCPPADPWRSRRCSSSSRWGWPCAGTGRPSSGGSCCG
mmetsp:Transcript_23235/g.49460  ORF Transcript_23235/g.49460 Transcript_23235/m.49460 type:complete len:262 (-) Transcript_23235:167-952(-)